MDGKWEAKGGYFNDGSSEGKARRGTKSKIEYEMSFKDRKLEGLFFLAQ